jgi:hypothetical protein
MTRRKTRPCSQGEMLKALPGECGPRELAKILGVSPHTPKHWRKQGLGPAYQVKNGRITYKARSVVTWLHQDCIGQQILKRVRWLTNPITDSSI